MKKILYIINITLLLITLSSCGSSDTQEGDNIAKIDVINCDLSNSNHALNDCIGYTCINKKDTLVSNTNDTVLQIIHFNNDDKKVCVQNGSAHILR